MSLANSVELPVVLPNHPEAALCRVCNVSSSNCLPLFKQHLFAGKITTLAKVLIYCTGLEIREEEDFLPQHICPDCMAKMQTSLQFKRSVHRMDRLLRQSHLDLSLGKSNKPAKDPIPDAEKVSEQYIFVDEDGQPLVMEIDKDLTETDETKHKEVKVELNRDTGPHPERQQLEGEDLATNWIQITENDQVVEAEILEEDIYELVEEPKEQVDLPKQPKAAISARNQRRKTQNPKLQCQICCKQLSTSNSFKYHMQLHGTATPYVCQICGESFKTRNAHDGHVTLHDPNNPNRCPTCGKVYRQASSLRSHLLTHSGIKPFECNICGKRLTQNSGYKKHMLTHTGEKPHSCEICGRTFRYSSNLIAHKRCHSQEKPHECQVCHKRSFGSTSELNRHMLVHSGERPFVCGECGKTFKRQVSLSLHQQSHKPGRNKWSEKVVQAEEDHEES